MHCTALCPLARLVDWRQRHASPLPGDAPCQPILEDEDEDEDDNGNCNDAGAEDDHADSDVKGGDGKLHENYRSGFDIGQPDSHLFGKQQYLVHVNIKIWSLRPHGGKICFALPTCVFCGGSADNFALGEPTRSDKKRCNEI